MKSRQTRQQPVMGKRRQHADAERLACRRSPGAGDALLQRLQRRLYRRQQLSPGGIQAHTAPAPFKQRRADRLLQQLNLLADRAVRQMHLLRRSAQIFQPGGDRKGRQDMQGNAFTHHWLTRLSKKVIFHRF